MNVELSIERTLDGNTTSGANVTFNNIVTKNGKIYYNASTGVITFNQTGTYIVNWFVVIEATLSDIGSALSLSLSTGEKIQGNSNVKAGEVTGFGIIHVYEPGETLSLVNTTPNIIKYSTNVPIKASLLLFQKDSTVTGPTGPTGITGEKGATGPTGSSSTSFSIIPFSALYAVTYADYQGNSTSITPLGYGAQPLTMFINPDGTYLLNNYTPGFSLPYDVLVQNICFSVNSSQFFQFIENMVYYPYIELFSAPAGSSHFIPVDRSIVYASTGFTNTSENDVVLYGNAKNLNIKLQSETQLIITVRLKIEVADNLSEDEMLYLPVNLGGSISLCPY